MRVSFWNRCHHKMIHSDSNRTKIQNKTKHKIHSLSAMQWHGCDWYWIWLGSGAGETDNQQQFENDKEKIYWYISRAMCIFTKLPHFFHLHSIPELRLYCVSGKYIADSIPLAADRDFAYTHRIFQFFFCQLYRSLALFSSSVCLHEHF